MSLIIVVQIISTSSYCHSVPVSPSTIKQGTNYTSHTYTFIPFRVSNKILSILIFVSFFQLLISDNISVEVNVNFLFSKINTITTTPNFKQIHIHVFTKCTYCFIKRRYIGQSANVIVIWIGCPSILEPGPVLLDKSALVFHSYAHGWRMRK